MQPKEVLIQERENKMLTQQGMADKLGISLRNYQRYEEGLFPKHKTDTDTIESVLELLIDKLNQLADIFHQLPLHKKHQFLNILFPNGLSYTEGYTTTGVNMLFKDKALILNKKGLLKLTSNPKEFKDTPVSTPDGSIIETLEAWMRVFAA